MNEILEGVAIVIAMVIGALTGSVIGDGLYKAKKRKEAEYEREAIKISLKTIARVVEAEKRRNRIEKMKENSKRKKACRYVNNGSGIPPIWRRK